MKAILTCCVCFTRAEVDAKMTINGDDVETWWLLRRRQTCGPCYKHTCWAPMGGDDVCFLDLEHSGDHKPWHDEYGETDPQVPPIQDLWAGWDRRVHATAP